MTELLPVIVNTHSPSQQAHDVEITSHWRRCDVMTSHRRQCDVMTSHRRQCDVISTSCRIDVDVTWWRRIDDSATSFRRHKPAKCSMFVFLDWYLLLAETKWRRTDIMWRDDVASTSVRRHFDIWVTICKMFNSRVSRLIPSFSRDKVKIHLQSFVQACVVKVPSSLQEIKCRVNRIVPFPKVVTVLRFE